jgi:hypothetical protein
METNCHEGVLNSTYHIPQFKGRCKQLQIYCNTGQLIMLTEENNFTKQNRSFIFMPYKVLYSRINPGLGLVKASFPLHNFCFVNTTSSLTQHDYICTFQSHF